MKTSIIVVVGIGVIVIGGVALFFTKPAWFPGYCGKYSGTHYYGWNTGGEDCLKAGCKMEKIEEINQNSLDMDTGGYTFNCVRK